MKTAMVLLATVLVSQSGFAHGLTEGSYKGSGAWASAGGQGAYRVTTVIGPKTIQTSYLLPSKEKRDWNFEISASTSGFFDVTSNGTKLGSGYCLDKAPVCHYEVSLGALKVEETLVQQDGKLYRFGSKDEGQGPIRWQESADKE
jgi:hypothetical protein